MTLSGEEDRASGVAGQHRVEPARRPVDQDRAGGEQLIAREPALLGGDLEHVQDRLNGVGRDRRALVYREAPVVVLDDEVGKGPAGVDSEPHATTLTSPGTVLSIRTSARIVNMT